MKKLKKTKEGAASFYVVVFATLILLVVVISFAAIIATEMTKSSNDDLSQSAYNSAIAGIEDAKLAYYDYQNCVSQVDEPIAPNDDGKTTCAEIRWYMEASEQDYANYNEGKSEKDQIDRCDMVKNILGRGDDLALEESNTGGVSNNMQQDYTCVKIDDVLSDYRATLSSSNTTKVVKAKFAGVTADQIKKVKISWYTDTGVELNYRNLNEDKNKVVFTSLAATPPTISLALLQTAESFNLSDFDTTHGESTNRGMLYLVPTEYETLAKNSKEGNYIGVYKDGMNQISSKEGFLKSNDKTVQNNPYAVYCGDGGEFLCSATIEIPEPVGGKRNNDTFVFVVGLPYGKPLTDFSMEFYCADNEEVPCGKSGIIADSGESSGNDNRASLKSVQINIDSTGRANDLYRRVETRLEDSSGYSLSTFGALELLGGIGGVDSNDVSFEKQLVVTSEYNF